MESNYNVTAKVFDDCVEIDTNCFGNITKEIVDMKCRIQDDAIRQWLINNGWTPPTEDTKDYALFEEVECGVYEQSTVLLSYDKAKEHYDKCTNNYKSIWKRVL